MKEFKNWMKGLGVAAFLFFLLKGLIWLAIFLGLARFIGRYFYG